MKAKSTICRAKCYDHYDNLIYRGGGGGGGILDFSPIV